MMQNPAQADNIGRFIHASLLVVAVAIEAVREEQRCSGATHGEVCFRRAAQPTAALHSMAPIDVVTSSRRPLLQSATSAKMPAELRCMPSLITCWQCIVCGKGTDHGQADKPRHKPYANRATCTANYYIYQAVATSAE